MRLRVACTIVLLHSQPLSRVVRLTVDDTVHDGDAVLLRLGEPPSPVPTPGRSPVAGAHRYPRQHEHRHLHQPGLALALPQPPDGQPLVSYHLPTRACRRRSVAAAGLATGSSPAPS
jgi:hypothetical protein